MCRKATESGERLASASFGSLGGTTLIGGGGSFGRFSYGSSSCGCGKRRRPVGRLPSFSMQTPLLLLPVDEFAREGLRSGDHTVQLGERHLLCLDAGLILGGHHAQII